LVFRHCAREHTTNIRRHSRSTSLGRR
jgi:hypothetical protein